MPPVQAQPSSSSQRSGQPQSPQDALPRPNPAPKSAPVPPPDGASSATVAPGALVFLTVGDWGMRLPSAKAVAKQMGLWAELHGAAFVVSVGDNFYPYGVKDVHDRQFETTFERMYSAKALQIPWYLVLGNHDYAFNGRKGNTTAQLLYRCGPCNRSPPGHGLVAIQPHPPQGGGDTKP